MRLRAAAALILMASLSGHVAAAAPNALTVDNAWSRATAPGASVGVVYFDVVNAGEADVLESIECACATRVEMHSTTNADGVMQMRQTMSAEIPARGRVRFEPGGLHAMLIELKQPLKAGDPLSLTLVFRRAGRLPVAAVVRGLGASKLPARPAEGAATAYRLAVWPAHAHAPDFALLDPAGRRRTLVDYRGRVVVIFFGFLRCPDVCPAELFKLALVMQRLGDASGRVRVVFITLDPERDTRQALHRYVTAFDSRFIGLTGSNGEVDAAAASFSVEYARVPHGAGYSIDHSTSSFVLDPSGRLRLVGSMKSSVEDFTHDIAALLAER